MWTARCSVLANWAGEPEKMVDNANRSWYLRLQGVRASTFLTEGHYRLATKYWMKAAVERVGENFRSLGDRMVAHSLQVARSNDYVEAPLPSRNAWTTVGRNARSTSRGGYRGRGRNRSFSRSSSRNRNRGRVNKVDFPPLKKLVSAAAGAAPKAAPKKAISLAQMKQAVEEAQGMADSDTEQDTDASQAPKKSRTRSPSRSRGKELVQIPIG